MELGSYAMAYFLHTHWPHKIGKLSDAKKSSLVTNKKEVFRGKVQQQHALYGNMHLRPGRNVPLNCKRSGGRKTLLHRENKKRRFENVSNLKMNPEI
jgi:hypothetical protein